MGFPYLAPFKKRVRDKLKEREDNPKLFSKYIPFVILSSAAVVVKNKTSAEIKNLLKPDSKDILGEYCGCIIANSTEKFNSYQTGETLAGYDLNGKPIKVTR